MKALTEAQIEKTIKNCLVLNELITDKQKELSELEGVLERDAKDKAVSTMKAYSTQNGYVEGASREKIVEGAPMICGISDICYQTGNFSFYDRCGERYATILRSKIENIYKDASIKIRWVPQTAKGLPRPNLAFYEYIKYSDIVKEEETA